jgi:hypothetical protein
MSPDIQGTTFKDITTIGDSSDYQLSTATTGGHVSSNYFPIPVGSNFLKQAWGIVYRVKDKELSKEAEHLLLIIHKNISYLQQRQIDLSYLPPLNAKETEDGSILFEFVHQDYRFGFIIGPKPSDSGWYLVTSKKMGGGNNSGFLSDVNIETLVSAFLNFIITYS